MSFSRWQTESDTRIAKVVVSVAGALIVRAVPREFSLKGRLPLLRVAHHAAVLARDLCVKYSAASQRNVFGENNVQKTAAIANYPLARRQGHSSVTDDYDDQWTQ